MGSRATAAVLALASAVLVGPVAPVGVAANGGSPPETTITSGPRGPIGDSSASFEFGSSEPGSSFECRLDGGVWTLRSNALGPVPHHVFVAGWEACASPKSYSGIHNGSHVFEVRAVGPGGATDPTPAARSFSVDTGVGADVGAPRTQRQHRGTVRVRVEVSAEEAVEVTLGGKVKLPAPRARGRRAYELASRSIRLAEGETRAPKLRPAVRSHERRVARALRRGRRARARVTLELRNELGGELTRRLVVRLRRG